MCSPWEALTQVGDHVMCGICLEWKTHPELHRDTDGQLVDVCKPCAPYAGYSFT
jgi:hypothetical protein